MSLYTKYRPKDFENLVGQDFIKETLKKAIIEEKTVWAYLFCWPRWTWKTSTARLFAKSINCLDLKNWNPCNKCENCRDFIEEKSLDIIEMDAASQTWVENIRDLIEKSEYLPTKAKYKIYIIDEVHMLSAWAFNALLKTLEEPPKHVKFILATTETHKVPETIISRCQRYDFKRINEKSLKERLLYIAEKENIEIDEKSINYIIKSSNWWLRNAISLFEQLIDWNKIIYSEIIEKLWITSFEIIENFLKKLEEKDISLINDFDNLVDSWKNLKLFFRELIFTVKDKIIENIKSQKNINNLINIFEILDETYLKTKNSIDENTTFLVWILKIIWWYKNIFSEKIEKEIPEKIFSKKTEEIKKENLEKDLINEEDLDDIFWKSDDIFEKEMNFSEKIDLTEKFKNNSSNSNFDVNNFIEKIKENWAKWALSMSLRWAKLSISENNLIISWTTKITKINLQNAENQVLMLKTLEYLWFKDFKIIIN